MLGIARDITERIQSEETREELERQLHRSKERERTHHVSDETVQEISSLLGEATSYLAAAKQKSSEELRSILEQTGDAVDRAIQLASRRPSDEA